MAETKLIADVKYYNDCYALASPTLQAKLNEACLVADRSLFAYSADNISNSAMALIGAALRYYMETGKTEFVPCFGGNELPVSDIRRNDAKLHNSPFATAEEVAEKQYRAPIELPRRDIRLEDK